MADGACGSDTSYRILLLVPSKPKYDAITAPLATSKDDGPQPNPAVVALNGNLALRGERAGHFVILQGYQMAPRTLIEPIVHTPYPSLAPQANLT